MVEYFLLAWLLSVFSLFAFFDLFDLCSYDLIFALSASRLANEIGETNAKRDMSYGVPTKVPGMPTVKVRFLRSAA